MVKYSQKFKDQVVNVILSGELLLNEASLKYGVAKSIIIRWINNSLRKCEQDNF